MLQIQCRTLDSPSLLSMSLGNLFHNQFWIWNFLICIRLPVKKYPPAARVQDWVTQLSHRKVKSLCSYLRYCIIVWYGVGEGDTLPIVGRHESHVSIMYDILGGGGAFKGTVSQYFLPLPFFPIRSFNLFALAFWIMVSNVRKFWLFDFNDPAK